MKEVSCCKYSLCRVGGLLLLLALSGFSIGITAHMHMTTQRRMSMMEPDGLVTRIPVKSPHVMPLGVEAGTSRT